MWIIVGVACAIGLIYYFGKRRTEKTEEVSNSPFGYMTLIPVYALLCLICIEGDLIFSLLTLVAAFIGYTIYRRGFRYKPSDIAILVILSLATAAGIIL